MQRRLALAALVVLAGCGAFQSPGVSPTPPTNKSTPLTETDRPCMRGTIPIAELSIFNDRLTRTGAPQTVVVLIRKTPAGSNRTTVVFNRQFTIPEDGAVEVMDIPGWPTGTADRFVLVVRVMNGTTVTQNLSELSGQVISVFVDDEGVDVQSANSIPATHATCTPREATTGA